MRLVTSCRRLPVWLLRYLAVPWRVPSPGIASRELTAGGDRPPAGTSVASVDDVLDLFRSGEPVDVVAEEFGLSRDEVEDAIRVVTRAGP